MNKKMTNCKVCGTEIAKNAKRCPHCGAKNKKPIYKRGWFIFLVVILAFSGYSRIRTALNKGLINPNKKESKKETEIIYEDFTREIEKNEKENYSIETIEPISTYEPEPTIVSTPEPVVEETNLVDGMRPEFKQAMDDYERFMQEYCNFMEKYAASDGNDLSILADYASYMAKYSDMVNSFEKWDEGTMNDAETSYYLQVQSRVLEMLSKVSY